MMQAAAPNALTGKYLLRSFLLAIEGACSIAIGVGSIFSP
jgi:hypothetical protein